MSCYVTSCHTMSCRYRLYPECFDRKVNRTNPTPLRMAPNVAQRPPG